MERRLEGRKVGTVGWGGRASEAGREEGWLVEEMEAGGA